MGSFVNPDTTRIIAKRVVLTGHPFKVHKKTATVRYMFFNPGTLRHASFLLVIFRSWRIQTQFLRSLCVYRRRTLLQTYSTPYKTRTNGPHSRISRHAWVFQSSLRRTHQPNGYGVHVTLQARFSQVGESVDCRKRGR